MVFARNLLVWYSIAYSTVSLAYSLVWYGWTWSCIHIHFLPWKRENRCCSASLHWVSDPTRSDVAPEYSPLIKLIRNQNACLLHWYISSVLKTSQILNYHVSSSKLRSIEITSQESYHFFDMLFHFYIIKICINFVDGNGNGHNQGTSWRSCRRQTTVHLCLPEFGNFIKSSIKKKNEESFQKNKNLKRQPSVEKEKRIFTVHRNVVIDQLNLNVLGAFAPLQLTGEV